MAETRTPARERRHRFPVTVEWLDGRLVETRVEGKDPVRVATPPEFGGVAPGVWSPEDLLVAATASCYAVTLVAVAERRGVPLHRLAVDAVGTMALEEGRLCFVGIDLQVAVETDADAVEHVHSAALRAEHGCFVSAALSVPVRVELEVAPAGLDRAA